MTFFLERTRISGNGVITQGLIDAERIANIADDGVPHRIHFPTTHITALKRNAGGKWVGRFSLPFRDTVGPLFEADTGLDLFNSKFGGCWRSINTDDEFDNIQEWVSSQNSRVFIRNCLPLCLALDFNLQSEGEYTEIGNLEDQAKSHQEESAISELVDICCATISSLPFYRDARFIAAVPPRPGKGYDLPSVIVDRVCSELGLHDLTPTFE